MPRSIAAVMLMLFVLAASGAGAQQPTPAIARSAPEKPAIAKSTLPAAPPWADALARRLAAVDAAYPGEIGVYVHHVGRDESWGLRADEPWYLASGVKVPIAIAVMREIEQGWLTLDTEVTLLETDFVDGAGRTNAHRAGDRLTIAWLLDQMIVYSDNTASDVLIRTVGLGQVNAVAAELIASQGVHITTLADVRRLAYGMLHAGAAQLSSQDLLALQRAGVGRARVLRLAQLLSVSPDTFLAPDLDTAFESYYATHVNSATLGDYGRMLVALQQGLALDAEHTAYLLGVMSRVKTGQRRIRAGLPPTADFAHKTGTQYRRLCDSGIVTMPAGDAPPVQVVVAACVRGPTGATGERALRSIGEAVTASGVLNRLDPPPLPLR